MKYTFEDYAKDIAPTTKYPKLKIIIDDGDPIDAPWLYPLLGVLGETGEIAEKFKKFVFETKFLEIFDIDEQLIQKIKESDEELLKFAITWLRFGLIDQSALKVKDGFKAPGML